MRTRRTLGGGALLLLSIAMTPGCEDSDVTAPAGSTITLIPSPSAVFIDSEGGATTGTTTLIAQVVDAGGLPLGNIPLFFTTSGGLLASADNICIGNVCSRSATDCSVNPCPQLPSAPVAIETNNSGVATDTLLLRLIEDPDSVDVTVQGTNLTALVTVPKSVNIGTNPIANIVMSPSSGQLTGEIFIADGTGSTFDPTADPTCYDWTINSSLPGEPSISRRGPDLSILNDLIAGVSGDPADEQTLSISLRVSDKPSIDCTPNGTPDPNLFSIFPASVTYLIRCDLTPPNNVDAGTNQFFSLSASPDDPPNVSAALSATAQDPEFPDLAYSWDCGGGVCSAGPSVCTADPSTTCITNQDCIVDTGPCPPSPTCTNDPTTTCTTDQDCIVGMVDMGPCAQTCTNDPSTTCTMMPQDCMVDTGPCASPTCDQQSVTCTYFTEGTFTATVIVQNECGLSTQDSLTVTVNPN